MTAVVNTLAGYAAIGRLLMVSNNQVYAWHKRQASSGFPEPVEVARSRWVGPLFDINQVLTWYATYEPAKGGQPRGVRNSGSGSKRCRRADGTFA